MAHVADVASACEFADEELTGVYNVDTEEAYSFNEMVGLINDALGTGIAPACAECPVDGYVRDTMADASKFREATGWEPEIDFVNYPTLLALTRSLRAGLPASMTRFADTEASTGSAVSTGVPSECPTPSCSTGKSSGTAHAFCRV